MFIAISIFSATMIMFRHTRGLLAKPEFAPPFEHAFDAAMTIWLLDR